jgi:hypothetical protein
MGNCRSIGHAVALIISIRDARRIRSPRAAVGQNLPCPIRCLAAMVKKQTRDPPHRPHMASYADNCAAGGVCDRRLQTLSIGARVP